MFNGSGGRRTGGIYASIGRDMRWPLKSPWIPCTAVHVVLEAPSFRVAKQAAHCLGQLRDKELNRRHGHGLRTTILFSWSWICFMELIVFQCSRTLEFKADCEISSPAARDWSYNHVLSCNVGPRYTSQRPLRIVPNQTTVEIFMHLLR